MYRYNGITIILVILVIIMILAVGIAVGVRKDKIKTGTVDENGIINTEEAILKKTYSSEFYETRIVTVIYEDGTVMQSNTKWKGENTEDIKENFKVMRTLLPETMNQINAAIEKVKNSKLTSNYATKDYGIEIKENSTDTKFISLKQYSQSAIDELNSLISKIIPNYN